MTLNNCLPSLWTMVTTNFVRLNFFVEPLQLWHNHPIDVAILHNWQLPMLMHQTYIPMVLAPILKFTITIEITKLIALPLIESLPYCSSSDRDFSMPHK